MVFLVVVSVLVLLVVIAMWKGVGQNRTSSSDQRQITEAWARGEISAQEAVMRLAQMNGTTVIAFGNSVDPRSKRPKGPPAKREIEKTLEEFVRGVTTSDQLRAAMRAMGMSGLGLTEFIAEAEKLKEMAADGTR